MRLPPHAGFAWRGAFGWALKRTVCAMRLRPCEGCMLAASCIYPYVFETPPPETSRKMKLYDRVPHPFALRVGPTKTTFVEPGDLLSLDLVTVGNASRHIPYFVRAFEIAGRKGLSSRRVPLTLVRAERVPPTLSVEPEVIYAPDGAMIVPGPETGAPPAQPDRAVIRIETPLRLKERGHLIQPAVFAPRHLLSSLVRRISMLMYFHTETELEADFAMLKAEAGRVEAFGARLTWQDLTRKSSRQDTLMQMGGLIGSFTIDLQRSEKLWPYLWLGQFIQAGKGTTMGLGCYRIVDGPEPSAENAPDRQ